jgi:hypothetical protein
VSTRLKFNRLRQRQRQARYEARLRAGVAAYCVFLGSAEIDKLIALGWLKDGDEGGSALQFRRACSRSPTW